MWPEGRKGFYFFTPAKVWLLACCLLQTVLSEGLALVQVAGPVKVMKSLMRAPHEPFYPLTCLMHMHKHARTFPGDMIGGVLYHTALYCSCLHAAEQSANKVDSALVVYLANTSCVSWHLWRANAMMRKCEVLHICHQWRLCWTSHLLVIAVHAFLDSKVTITTPNAALMPSLTKSVMAHIYIFSSEEFVPSSRALHTMSLIASPNSMLSAISCFWYSLAAVLL